MQNDLEKCFKFILELEKLKNITRKVKPLGLERYENSAEHSWQVTVLAMTLAKYSDAEIEIDRVIKMLLVHDIGEIDAGDVMFFDEAGKAERMDKEVEAVERILGILPEETGEEFLELWKEMEYGNTKEAKYARAIDRVMPIVQNLYNKRQSWDENGIVKEQILSKTSYIGDASELVWETLAKKIENAFD